MGLHASDLQRTQTARRGADRAKTPVVRTRKQSSSRSSASLPPPPTARR